MDDLRKRLRRLQQAYGATRGPGRPRSGEGAEGAPCPKVVSLRDQLERMHERQRSGPSRPEFRVRAAPLRLEDVLPGSEVTTPQGSCYEVKAVYRDTYRHGDQRIEAFYHVDMNAMNLFFGGEKGDGVRPEEVLFMDLETTGLSLGTGTYAFLVGLGYFRDRQFHIHQVFLRAFDEEPAFLYRTQELIEPFRYLVTFNGKGFDVPLLEARFTMCSQPGTLRDMVSWDLLHPARRLWFGRLQDCRLQTIERERLGVAREGMDIAGDEIPRVYFRFVHEGDARDMDRIAYHNAMDVLTMTALTVHIDQALKAKDGSRSNLFSVGRYYERRGIEDKGAEYYEAASFCGHDPRERDMALFHLARQRKKEGRFDESVRIWQELVERDGYGFLSCCVEISKHLEHRTREYEKAVETVLLGLSRAGPDESRIRADLQKRLGRLNRKKGTS